jgi:hypothetical protein
VETARVISATRNARVGFRSRFELISTPHTPRNQESLPDQHDQGPPLIELNTAACWLQPVHL